MPGFDFGPIIKDADQFHAKTKKFAEKASEIVGTGQSDDGKVTVRWRQDCVAKIELDPKAMRMSSEEVAETITETVRRAKEDYQRAVTELREEILGGGGETATDPESLREAVAELQSVFQGTLQATTTIIDSLRRTFRG